MSDWGTNNIERLKAALEARKLRTQTQLAGRQSITDALTWGGEQILGALGARAKRKHETGERLGGEAHETTLEQLRNAAETARGGLARAATAEQEALRRQHEKELEEGRLAQEKELREKEMTSRERAAEAGAKFEGGRVGKAVNAFIERYGAATALKMLREGRRDEIIDTYVEEAAEDYGLSPSQKLALRNSLIRWFGEVEQAEVLEKKQPGDKGSQVLKRISDVLDLTPDMGITDAARKMYGEPETLTPERQSGIQAQLDALKKVMPFGAVRDKGLVGGIEVDIRDGTVEQLSLMQLAELMKGYNLTKTPGTKTGMGAITK